MSSKTSEMDTATRFLRERGIDFDELLTLKEFAQLDPEHGLDVKHLDSSCPDVVAISKGEAIGLELTAYSDDEPGNRLDSNIQSVVESSIELVRDFPDLHGFTIHFSPKVANVFEKRNKCPLAMQLLDFV